MERLLLVAVGWFGALQTIAQHTLPPAGTESPEGFTRISSIRELRDGRVLVVDSRDAVVRLVDFARGSATQVGRQGGGPGEYRSPSLLLPLGGDSTLLTDPRQGRSIVIGPGGVAGDVLLSGTALANAPFGARNPAAADAKGRLYFQSSAPDPGGAPVARDSAELLRFDPASGRVDTLTRIKLPWTDIRVDRANGKITQVSVFRVPFMAQDDWTVLADGRVVVVRTGDFHLEVLSADGRVTRGAPIPYTPVAVTDAERKRAPWAQIPRHKPPFEGRATFAAPDGRIWVKRSTAESDSTARYHVLEATGRLVARVSLPPRTRLAGFGKESAYLVRSDADDIEYLGRIPLPRL